MRTMMLLALCVDVVLIVVIMVPVADTSVRTLILRKRPTEKLHLQHKDISKVHMNSTICVPLMLLIPAAVGVH